MAAVRKECVLYDRYCIECGECNICDLDKNKICDNCCKCIEEDADYVGIDIDGIIAEEDLELEDHLYTEQDCEIEEDPVEEDMVEDKGDKIKDLKNNWRYDEPYSVDINKNNDK